jgi:hypothetical protein
MKFFVVFLCLMASSFLYAQVNADDYYYTADLPNTKPTIKVVNINHAASAAPKQTPQLSGNDNTFESTVGSSNLKYTSVIKNVPDWALIECSEMASKRRNYIVDIYNKGKRFFPKVNKIFAKYKVPSDLNVILAIESYFKQDIVSHSGAVGYWQFMDATAEEYGLSIDSTNDERKDFTKSTTAAAKYLRNHYKIFNDWYLTVASYNCGGGTVKKAMAKSKKEHPDFFDIKHLLPKETQNYVMKYITLNLAYKNYKLYLQNKLQWYVPKKEMPNNGSYTAADKLTNSFILE